MARLAKTSWRKEPDCRELKTDRGLDSFEGPSFHGLHRHLTMIGAAHLFMLHFRDGAGDLHLAILNEKEGVWRCHSVFTCTEAHPLLTPTRHSGHQGHQRRRESHPCQLRVSPLAQGCSK